MMGLRENLIAAKTYIDTPQKLQDHGIIDALLTGGRFYCDVQPDASGAFARDGRGDRSDSRVEARQKPCRHHGPVRPRHRCAGAPAMTSPLDEKGRLDAIFAYSSATGDCDPEAMIAAIRAYLSATALPDGMEVVAWRVTDATGNCWLSWERPKGGLPADWKAEPLITRAQAHSTIAALRAISEAMDEEVRVAMRSMAEQRDRADTAEAQVKRLTEEKEGLRETLSEGLDLCERARKMDAMEKERAEMYLRNPEMTRSATIPLWAEEQYQRDLAEWEAKAKKLMPHPFTPTPIRSLPIDSAGKDAT